MKTKNTDYSNGSFVYCRSCYDHLAGKVAIDIVNAMEKQKLISIKGDQFTVSNKGEKWFQDFGINLDEVKKSKRKFGATCTDRTEKKEHLGGSLGAAFLSQLEKKKWVERKEGSRVVKVTAKGVDELKKLGINVPQISQINAD